MKKYTKEEQIQILEKANFPQGLSRKESLNVLWWTLFCPKKLSKFIELVEHGQHIYFAYKTAKNER